MSKLKTFFTANISGSGWLVTLRVGTAVALICKIASEYRYIDQLYGSDGFIPVDLAVYSQNPHIPAIPGIFHYVSRFCSEHHFLQAFFICQLIFAISLLAGYMTRFSALVCWLMMVIVFNSSHLTSYGFDAILLTLLFYSFIFPVGYDLSMDNRSKAKVTQRDDSLIHIFQKTIQIHVCLIYLVNGISKIDGSLWTNGLGLWDAINQPQFHSLLTPFFQKLFMIPFLPGLLGTSVLIIEIAYPFMIWVRQTRKAIFILIILLHILIAVVMGLWLFALAMIVLNAVAFGHVMRREKAQET